MELRYGLRNDVAVHISNVPRGIDCDCVCPACGGALVAKKGKAVSHHFAHYKLGSCRFGYQTLLQSMALEIIKTSKCIKLPAVEFETTSFGLDVLKEPCVLQVDSASLEFRLGNTIPDLVVRSGDKELIIHIFVSLKLDKDRLQKAKELNCSILEIDVSDTNRLIGEDELLLLLMGTSPRKRWKYNSYKDYWARYFDLYICEALPIANSCVADCPLVKAKNKDSDYKKYSSSCRKCEYFQNYLHRSMGYKVSAVKCSGRSRIPNIKMLAYSLQHRQLLEQEKSEIHKQIVEESQ